jgi:alpha-L-arabinofuranosidase
MRTGKNISPFVLLLLTVLLAISSKAQESPKATLTVRTDKPGISTSPMLYGIFFEEINCAGDGGLYAEMIRNRSFEESDKPDFWSLVVNGSAKGFMTVDTAQPLSSENRHSLRLTVTQVQNGSVGVANSGYWGIPVSKGSEYELSFYARCSEGFEGPVSVTLQGSGSNVFASGKIEGLTKKWKHFSLLLTSNSTDSLARLVITASHSGTIWLDVVTLFPKLTFRNRTNGVRQDLGEMLFNLHPSFARFPGGCWVEGDSLKFSYRWKQTIGDIGDRRTQYNIWQYYSTNGLGYHEYLQMCEDLRSEPLFVINCGMSHTQNVPMDQMGSWVQDALDAIEYANGPVESRWGALRAKNGHPAPFNLKYVEIGNENGGPAYNERYALFHDAIRSKYPGIHLIADLWGGTPKNRPVEIIDEHYYSSARFFISNATRYDAYDRNGPRIYVGEYAVTQGCGSGNLRAALAEAAFMTGMERNSDIVHMASYAPLFANVNYKKWNPDLINFNNSRVYGTPSYHVQKMFSENRGDVILPTELNAATVQEPVRALRGGIGLSTWETQAEFKDVRVTKDNRTLLESDFSKDNEGWRPISGDWKVLNGAFTQAARGTDRRAIAGDSSWSDYTYQLKARKLSGAEGFLIVFLAKDRDNWIWWNLGGWGNSRHAVEYCEEGGTTIIGKEVPGHIDTGRWYDIRVELKGTNIRCYLDGTLIQEMNYTQPPVSPLHAVAGRLTSTGGIILKVVNVSNRAYETQIDLKGSGSIKHKGKAIVLTSTNPLDENSMDEPEKVAPTVKFIGTVSSSFVYEFPPSSVTILRLQSDK